MSNHPSGEPFKEAFDTNTPQESPTDGVFDGSYQCRRCGTVNQIRMFAGAANPPQQITTDCEGCGGHRPSDGVPPDDESVLHRWYISFEDIYHDPPYLHVTATSRKAARTQIETEHPDRTIEVLTHLEARV
jgi:hypothetical protein